MPTDLSLDLVVIAMHGYRIRSFKTDMFNAYISIQPQNMMASSLLIDAWVIKYLYVL